MSKKKFNNCLSIFFFFSFYAISSSNHHSYSTDKLLMLDVDENSK